jgi:hypothetical protein
MNTRDVVISSETKSLVVCEWKVNDLLYALSAAQELIIRERLTNASVSIVPVPRHALLPPSESNLAYRLEVQGEKKEAAA